MNTVRSCAVWIVCCLLTMPAARADAPRQLKWEDLAPKLEASENPFAKLTREQLTALGQIANTRDRKAANDSNLSAVELENEQALTRKLQQSGLDVNGLLGRRQQMAEQQRASGSKLNLALDGQTVRIPGYLLPLEFSGKQVSEFLLVPWVGACIHTPPPPPNQIVHVKTDKPFEFTGLFSPVWVTGRMAAASTRKALYLIDGSSDIDIGYSLKASEVEPYKQ
jgi:uncharacterized protein